MKMKYSLIFLLCSIILLGACSDNWLELKRDIKLVVPKSTEDILALLDNFDVMNVDGPNIGEIGSDDFYVSEDAWRSLRYAPERNAYVWSVDIFENIESQEWNKCYQRIFYANVALDAFAELDAEQQLMNQNLKGMALFHRSWNYFHLTQLFCMSYHPDTENSTLGVPMRLTADINEEIRRPDIKTTYDQIISDLTVALTLVNERENQSTRPDKRAVLGLLAKVYLVMGNYEEALAAADSCLMMEPRLLDYKQLYDGNMSDYPFTKFNDETIFYSEMSAASIFLG